ncbi:orotate phosphoribosyltransferase [Candidatus Bathyarchaeota archaeon]|nr:MAG: orotate phosphoribosyltransferase [Candidatus Bathyarchaeota archaeon]
MVCRFDMKDYQTQEKFWRDAEEEICQILKRTAALEFGTFKLSSGRITPYYIDLRVIPSFPQAFRKVSEIYVEAIKRDIGQENFDRVSGIPVAGMSFAVIAAFHLNKPFIYVRQSRRLRGRERRVEGVLMPGDRVLLIDDLVTTGISLGRAARAIRAEGGVVTDAFVLLDREEGGRKRLSRAGITLHSVLKITDVAKRLYEMGTIDEDQLEIILKQVREKES